MARTDGPWLMMLMMIPCMNLPGVTTRTTSGSTDDSISTVSVNSPSGSTPNLEPTASSRSRFGSTIASTLQSPKEGDM